MPVKLNIFFSLTEKSDRTTRLKIKKKTFSNIDAMYCVLWFRLPTFKTTTLVFYDEL